MRELKEKLAYQVLELLYSYELVTPLNYSDLLLYVDYCEYYTESDEKYIDFIKVSKIF